MINDQDFIVSLTKHFVKAKIRRVDFIALVAKAELILIAKILDYPTNFVSHSDSFMYLMQSLKNYSVYDIERYTILQVFKDYMLHNGGLNA